MTTPNPTIVFLPGAWHTTAYYDPIRSALSAYGYPTIAISLPSLNPSTNIYDFTEDVQVIRAAVTQLVIDEKKDVVVVCHSYSGIPGPEALKNLGKLDRQKRGEEGGVVRLVLVMALMLQEGQPIAPYGDERSIAPHVEYDKEKNLVTAKLPLATSILYHDLPAAEATKWTALLLPHSAGVFWSVPTYAAWRYIPTTFVFCELDKALPMAYARPMVEACMNSLPNMVDKTESLRTGHFPFLTKVDDMVAVLRRAAGEDIV